MLKKTPKSVQELLSGSTLSRLQATDAKHSRLQTMWVQTVPADLAANSRCFSVQGQTLVIYARSGAWATRIRLLQTHIMRKFNEYPDAQVRSLDIQIKPTLE